MANVNSMNSKEFAQVANQAKKQVKGVFTSPFVIINNLNKAAKGDFSKVANCEGLEFNRIKEVAAQVRQLHGERYAFTFDLLPKSSFNKRLGWFKPVPAMQGECAAIMNGEEVYYNGKLLVLGANGVVGTFTDIALTEPAVFAAYCTIVRRNKQGEERAAREAAREEKRRAKELEKLAKARTAVTAVFGELAGTFSESEILSKYAAIKGAK